MEGVVCRSRVAQTESGAGGVRGESREWRVESRAERECSNVQGLKGSRVQKRRRRGKSRR